MSDDTTLSETGEASTLLPADRHPHLYLGLECERPTGGSSRHSLEDVDEVTIGRGPERSTTRRGRSLVLTVPDPRMSTTHSRLRRESQGWIVEDAASKNGTLVNEARVQRSVLSDGDLIECGRTFFFYRDDEVPLPDEPLDLEIAPADGGPTLATLVARLADRFDQMREVARTSMPILISGETGTGKEVVARAVHAESGRKGAFVPVNCGALPVNLVEAELFGARRGAYSGAVEDRPGLIRGADGGTLLLDEIGDLPLASQAALLRVLQEREVVPVGGSRPIPVDFRLVAATHRDLASLISLDRFRADLHARLSGFSMTLPPLRDRREDLGLLCAGILRDKAGAQAESVRISPEAARLLIGYDWPQNIRELEHCLERAVVLARHGVIRPSHLSDALSSDRQDRPTPPEELSPEDARLRARLIELLAEHAGNISAVARACQRQRVQIHRWLRRFGIDIGAYRKG